MALEEPEIEAVSGEVVPAGASPVHLTPQQLQAAVADAAGASRPEIARIADVSVSTVRSWRHMPAYIAEVERLAHANLESYNAPLKRLHQELIEGMSAAVKTLRDQLESTDPKGNPAESVRRQAAELLLTHGVALQGVAAKARNAEPGNPGGAPASGVVQLQINVGDQTAEASVPS